MAGGVVGKITTAGTGAGTHLLAHTFYGTCATAAATAAKIVKLSDSNINAATLITGMMLSVKFTYANGVASPTLTVQTSGGTQLIAAKSIMRYGTTAPSTNAATSWRAGAVVNFIYDGTNWVETSSIDDNSTYYYTSCYVSTAAGTAAKVGTVSNYALQKGHLQVLLMNANTAASALTLNVNGTGAKPIYINDVPSSSTNYTLPKAMYLVYYDGDNFQFRTDGLIPGVATGNATHVEVGNESSRAQSEEVRIEGKVDTINTTLNNRMGELEESIHSAGLDISDYIRYDIATHIVDIGYRNASYKEWLEENKIYFVGGGNTILSIENGQIIINQKETLKNGSHQWVDEVTSDGQRILRHIS